MRKIDKYSAALADCETLTSKEIINKYQLDDKEIEIMRYLYKKQKLKKDMVDNFAWNWEMSVMATSKIFGSLKKKGLIYSVIDFAGYLGTDIRV
jgi:hypothetical protein